MTEMKACIKCGPQPVSEFGKNASRKDGLQSRCRGCIREYNAPRRAAFEERHPDYMKNYRAQNAEHLKVRDRERIKRNLLPIRLSRHGLTREEFDRLMLVQDGLCAICRGPPTGRWKKLHIDHDHATGKVRGLLCESCNHGLGKFKDSPESLRRAADYLQQAAG